VTGNIDAFVLGYYGATTGEVFFLLEAKDFLRSGTLKTKARLKPTCLSRASCPLRGSFCVSVF
jgi:hypothetical protein